MPATPWHSTSFVPIAENIWKFYKMGRIYRIVQMKIAKILPILPILLDLPANRSVIEPH